jgi:protein-tyrosine phosphatase
MKHFSRWAAIVLFISSTGSAPALAKSGPSSVDDPRRVVMLERGSNFRDLGGYPAAGHRKVRWGLIFRSGAMPVLTETDYTHLARLGIQSIIDFRSIEERQIAPTSLDDRTGALYITNDYSLSAIDANMTRDAQGRFPPNLYQNFPTVFAPQYRALFSRLLAYQGPVLFNCSAGQDRTGTAAALILSALGVPREVIIADYHLSTRLRRPVNELPPINAADYPGNPIVGYYAELRRKGDAMIAEPLYGSDGSAYLEGFFQTIEQRWGSVDVYLQREIGLKTADIARLRRLYLQ